MEESVQAGKQFGFWTHQGGVNGKTHSNGNAYKGANSE